MTEYDSNCNNCGTQNTSDGLFCISCHKNLKLNEFDLYKLQNISIESGKQDFQELFDINNALQSINWIIEMQVNHESKLRSFQITLKKQSIELKRSIEIINQQIQQSKTNFLLKSIREKLMRKNTLDIEVLEIKKAKMAERILELTEELNLSEKELNLVSADYKSLLKLQKLQKELTNKLDHLLNTYFLETEIKEDKGLRTAVNEIAFRLNNLSKLYSAYISGSDHLSQSKILFLKADKILKEANLYPKDGNKINNLAYMVKRPKFRRARKLIQDANYQVLQANLLLPKEFQIESGMKQKSHSPSDSFLDNFIDNLEQNDKIILNKQQMTVIIEIVEQTIDRLHDAIIEVNLEKEILENQYNDTIEQLRTIRIKYLGEHQEL